MSFVKDHVNMVQFLVLRKQYSPIVMEDQSNYSVV